MKIAGDAQFNLGAEGVSTKRPVYETLRQKDRNRTYLWKAFCTEGAILFYIEESLRSMTEMEATASISFLQYGRKEAIHKTIQQCIEIYPEIDNDISDYI